MTNINTQRTILRRLKTSDLQNMVELESDPDITGFTSYHVPQTLEQTKTRLENNIAKEKERAPLGIWIAELKDSSDFVGWFMLLQTKHEFPELGFMLVKRHWGRGLATEISSTLIQYGFSLGHLGVNATTKPDNLVSKSVLKKLGFQFLRSMDNIDLFELIKK